MPCGGCAQRGHKAMLALSALRNKNLRLAAEETSGIFQSAADDIGELMGRLRVRQTGLAPMPQQEPHTYRVRQPPR